MATRTEVQAGIADVIEQVEDALKAWQAMAAMGLVRSRTPGAVVNALLLARQELWWGRDEERSRKKPHAANVGPGTTKTHYTQSHVSE